MMTNSADDVNVQICFDNLLQKDEVMNPNKLPVDLRYLTLNHKNAPMYSIN